MLFISLKKKALIGNEECVTTDLAGFAYVFIYFSINT